MRGFSQRSQVENHSKGSAMQEPTREELLQELADLRLRLEEAEDTLRAISQGDIDALVVSTPEGERVFTLKGADHSYRILVETINEGAATLSQDGKILYANRRLADLLQVPLERVIGSLVHDYVAPQDRPLLEALLQLRREDNRGEIRLQAANGLEVPTLLSVSLMPLGDGPDKLCLVVTDLTEQKHQQEILAAERLSRAILDQAEQAIVVLNDQGVITQASRAANRLYGGNLLLQQFGDAFPLAVQVQGPEANVPEEGFPLTGVLQGVIYQGVEAVFPRPDGQEFHVLLNAGPLLDESGTVLGGIVSLTDITARKQAEEARRTQAQILASMAEGVNVTDRHGYILYTNPAFDAMFGYEPGELEGRHSDILNHYPPEENLRVVQEIVRQVRSTGVWVGEFHNHRKDGGFFFTSARISALEVGGKKFFISVQEDITERKHREEMLRRQAELLDLAQDAILVRDMAGRVIYWNRGAEELYGWPREEAMGQVVHRLLATEFPEPLVDIENRLLEQGRWEGEVVHTTREGRCLVVEGRWSFKRDEAGLPLAILEINHDVTARRQTEEALRKSEARFRKLVEANIIGIAVSDEETVVEANDAFLQMLGYTREELYAGDINWVELTPHEYLPQDAQALYELRTTGAHTPFEKAFFRQDGSQVAVMVGGALLEEEPLIWVSFILDISERKQLEAALRQSEARFRAIFANASIGIATTDLEGYFQQFNAPVVRGLGYTPTELRSMTFFDVTHPDDLHKDAVLFAELAAGRRERYQVEKRYITKDGRVLWGRLHVSLARNITGDPEFAVSLVEDITARQEAQVARAESEARYRSLVDMSPDAILVHAGGRVVFTNPAGLELFKAGSPEEILGQHILDLVHPDYRDIVKRRVQRGYAGERADLREIKIWRLDGRVLDVETTATPITFQGKSAVQVMVRDITKRKLAEAELARQKDLLQGIIDNIPVMLTIYDPQIKAFRFNRELRRVLGWTEEEMSVEDPLELFYPDPDYREWAREYMQSLEPGWRDFRVTAKDGGVVDSTWANIRLTDDTRIGIGVDIRERKQAEEALRESREDLNRAQAVAHTGSWRLNVQKNELTWSEENHRIFGIPPGTPKTYETFLGTVHPEDREFVDRNWKAALTGEPYDIEHRIVVDGQVKWVRERAELEFDAEGWLRGGFGTTQDITEKKQAEEALRQNEARYRAIGELIPFGIWTAGPDGSWDYVSKSFLKMAGRTLEECQGFGWLHLLPSEDIQPTQKAWQHCLETGSFWDYEYKIKGKDGSWYTILSRGLPLADKQGRIISWVGINLDITERKDMEEALRRSHNELEKRVAERTAALRLANEELWGEISERHEAEKRLRESEARFSAFMQYLPGAAVMRDVQGRYIFANETWEKLTGKKGQEWRGKTVEDVWPPPQAKKFKNLDFQILSTGQPAEDLEELDLPDGRHYFLAQRFPIPDETGLPYMVGSIALDVTARRRAEETLAVERQRFFDLLENLPAFVYLQAQDYSLRFANREFRERFGEPDGGACYSLMWGRTEPCPECPTFTVFHTGQPTEWEWVAPDGCIYQVYDYPFADVDGTPLVLEMGIDITSRKQAEMEAARHAALVAGMNRILRDALVCETEEALGRTCLTVAEELTDSRFGFIDELNEQETFDALAFSDPGWDLCRLTLVENLAHLKNVKPKGLLGRPIREGQSLIANDPASHPDAVGIPEGHPPLTAYLGVPLIYGDQTFGLLGLGNKTGGYTDTDREIAETLAPSMVEALMHYRAQKDLKSSESKLRFLADQLLTAQENERKRLASELHDELGHALLALKLALSSIAKELLPTQENLKQEIHEQLEYINEVIEEVRRLYHDLSPGDVEDLGLTKALRNLIEDFAHLLGDINWEVDLANLDGFFSLPVKTIIYRLVQEALTNIGKHAHPEQVTISAAPADGQVHFVIQDDGAGFDMAAVLDQAGGLGLVAMEERLNMVGGSFELWSKPEEGTKISFSIPTRPEGEGA